MLVTSYCCRTCLRTVFRISHFSTVLRYKVPKETQKDDFSLPKSLERLGIGTKDKSCYGCVRAVTAYNKGNKGKLNRINCA